MKGQKEESNQRRKEETQMGIERNYPLIKIVL